MTSWLSQEIFNFLNIIRTTLNLKEVNSVEKFALKMSIIGPFKARPIYDKNDVNC